jgi:hypothetical protein
MKNFTFADFSKAAEAQEQHAELIFKNGTAVFTLENHGQTIELSTQDAADFIERFESQRKPNLSMWPEPDGYRKILAAYAPSRAWNVSGSKGKGLMTVFIHNDVQPEQAVEILNEITKLVRGTE